MSDEALTDALQRFERDVRSIEGVHEVDILPRLSVTTTMRGRPAPDWRERLHEAERRLMLAHPATVFDFSVNTLDPLPPE